MMNKFRFRLRLRHRGHQGLTLIETMISATLLLGIIYIAVLVYNNVQKSWILAQQEAELQQYSRTAITKISQELRQATAFYPSPPKIGQTYSYDVQFTIPESHAMTGAPTGNYFLVRYWYEENASTKVWSLYRAHKSNGTSRTIPTNAPPFVENKTTLLKEAAVVDPGQESYFYQDNSVDKQKIIIHLVTATYKPRSDGLATTSQEQVLLRKFRVETIVEARNLE